MYFRKPSWLILLATAVGVFCFSSLGVWQIQRAEEKKQILFDQASQTKDTLQRIRLPVVEPEKIRYQRILLQGSYISDKQFVLDNQIKNHKVGYNILTPFKLSNSSNIVLVDRGWVAIENSRERLPEISVQENQRSITGTVYVPFGEPFTLGEIDNGLTGWPRLIQYLDFNAMTQRSALVLEPFTLRLDSDQADGFLREWQTFAFSPNRHLAYAFQWFAIALTLIIIFIVLHVKKSKPS